MAFEPAERRIVGATTTAAALVPLNSTMIAVGLPQLARDLQVHRGAAAILVTAYLIAMAALQPFAGRLGDRLGNHHVVLVALTGFAVMSAAAGAAPTFTTLLVCRVVQAVFGSALIPNLQALLRAEIAEHRLGRAFGVFGAGIGTGAAVGPIVGGVLVDTVGWRGIFMVNTPVACVALALLVRLPRVVRTPTSGSDTTGRRPLRQLPFVTACITQGMSNFALYSVLLVIPLVLHDRGWGGAATGALLSGLTVGMLVLNPVGGAMGDRRGRTRPVVLGMVVLVLGAAALTAAAHAPTALLVPGVVLMGVGIGLAAASLQAAALGNIPREMAGSAAGLLSTSRYLGSIAGSLTIGALVGENVSGVSSVLAISTAASAVAAVAATRIEARGPRSAS
ncbi:MAG TPA: MFS transporter [Acidimicrobiales bacterium]|nr:MFS transporter [Acidimicrobiales bacterium]